MDQTEHVDAAIAAIRSENPGIAESELADLRARALDDLGRLPPASIAVIGLTGVGKSSTINALFNAGLPISHTEPCTQYPEPVEGDLSQFVGGGGPVVVYDMPGLGEDERADRAHLRAYREVLPLVDGAVWIIDAPSRVLTPIQKALKAIRRSCGAEVADRIVVAANKIDRVHPGDWNDQFNMPSREQDKVIEKYRGHLARALGGYLHRLAGPPVVYSATRRWGLEALMLEVVQRSKRPGVLGGAAEVADIRDLIDPRILRYLGENGSSLQGPPS